MKWELGREHLILVSDKLQTVYRILVTIQRLVPGISILWIFDKLYRCVANKQMDISLKGFSAILETGKQFDIWDTVRCTMPTIILRLPEGKLN